MLVFEGLEHHTPAVVQTLRGAVSSVQWQMFVKAILGE